MSRAVMFSINKPHTDNIKKLLKGSELRTRPPKIDEPYKAYIYETLKNGGCGKVIGEFTAFNEFKYRMCMGVPKHLVLSSCLSVEEIWAYTNKGEKDLTEISISDLVIYDEPKELGEFIKPCTNDLYCEICAMYNELDDLCGNKALKITRPPQSWCYVEEV